MVTSEDPAAVIAGLDPAIHPLRLKRFLSMDARVKPAHDKPGQWPQSKA
jgi:hypothetical protein